MARGAFPSSGFRAASHLVLGPGADERHRENKGSYPCRAGPSRGTTSKLINFSEVYQAASGAERKGTVGS